MQNYLQKYQQSVLEDVEEEEDNGGSGGDEAASATAEAAVGEDEIYADDTDDGAIQDGEMI